MAGIHIFRPFRSHATETPDQINAKGLEDILRSATWCQVNLNHVHKLCKTLSIAGTSLNASKCLRLSIH